jgi:hypothetical protein
MEVLTCVAGKASLCKRLGGAHRTQLGPTAHGDAYFDTRRLHGGAWSVLVEAELSSIRPPTCHR